MRAARGTGRIGVRSAAAPVLAACALGVLMMIGTAALAYWPSAGVATASVTTASLTAPTSVVASSAPGVGSVSVAWTGSTGVPAPTGYYVVRTLTSNGTSAPACGTSTTYLTAASVVTCTDSSVPPGTYTYKVSAVFRSWTAQSVASSSVVVVVADHLVFTTQPSGGTGGTALGTQPVVAVQDAGGNTVATDASTVTVALTSPGGAALSCSTNPKAAVAGVAAFAGCKVDKAGTYSLTATDGSLTSAVSSSFTITPGVAGKLLFSTQPSSGTGGTALGTQPTVTVQDAFGNTVTSDTSSVTLALTTPGGATLACTGNPRAAVAGVATFSGCRVDLPGSYTLTATDGALTSAVSSSFTITVGTAAKLGFSTQPGGGTSQTAFGAQPVVTVQDAGGNTVASSTSAVTLALTTPGGATLACTANPKAAASGVATFAGCKVDKAGTYTLTASGTSLTSAVSTSFTITAGAASRLGFTTQPSSGTGGTVLGTQPVVAVQDAFGNTVTSDTSSVTLALTTPGGATLTCAATTKGAVAGLATFAGCKVDKVGAYTLKATDGTLALATGSGLAITAGVPSRLMYVTEATGATPSCAAGSLTVGNGGSLTTFVALLDAGGNLAAAPSTATTVTLTKDSGGGDAPTPAALTILANASPAVTSSSTLFKLPNGNPGLTTYTATAGALSTSCTLAK